MNLNLFFDQFQGWPFQDHPPLNTITSRSSSHPMSPQPSSSQYCAMGLSYTHHSCVMDIYIIISRRVNPRSVNTLHINCLLMLLPRWLREQSSSDSPSQPASHQPIQPASTVIQWAAWLCVLAWSTDECGESWVLRGMEKFTRLNLHLDIYGNVAFISTSLGGMGRDGVGRWCPECASCQPRMNEGGEEICVETIVWTDPFADDRCRPSSSSMGCLGWNISEIIEWKYLNRCSFHSSTLWYMPNTIPLHSPPPLV